MGTVVRVQRVVMAVTGVESWTVIDDSWAPVAPVERYLAHLAGIERSPNTVRAYAFGLRFWFEFLEARGLVWGQVGVEDVSRLLRVWSRGGGYREGRSNRSFITSPPGGRSRRDQ